MAELTQRQGQAYVQPSESPHSPEEFLHRGTRAAVDQVLERSAKRGSLIGAPAGDGCFAGSSASSTTPIAPKITMSHGLSLLCIPLRRGLRRLDCHREPKGKA